MFSDGLAGRAKSARAIFGFTDRKLHGSWRGRLRRADLKSKFFLDRSRKRSSGDAAVRVTSAQFGRVLNGVAEMSHIEGQCCGGAKRGIHYRHDCGMRFGVQRISELDHHIWIGNKRSVVGARDEGHVGKKQIRTCDLLEYGVGDRRNSWNTLSIGIDLYFDTERGVFGDSSRSLPEGNVDKVGIEFPLRVALPGIKHNHLSHGVGLHLALEGAIDLPVGHHLLIVFFT